VRTLLRLGSLVALAFSAALAVDYLGPEASFCSGEGGCAAVRRWAGGFGLLGRLLPVVGLLAYGGLFAGSLVERRRTLRITGALAALGGLLATALIALQVLVVGALCGLCLGVDVAAIVAGLAGLALLLGEPGELRGDLGLASPWWGLLLLAVGLPLAWPAARPAPPAPDAIQALWSPRPDDVEVVELLDFECPFCRRIHPRLTAALEGADDVHLTRLILPLPMHVHARASGLAYLCAVEAGLGEAMADRLFASEDLSTPALLDAADEVGLGRDRLEACFEAPDERPFVEAQRVFSAAGVRGLPTVFIGHQRLVGAQPDAAYRRAVAAAVDGRDGRLKPLPLALVLMPAALVALFFARRRRAAVTPPPPR
jgi:predicted DsbA family dithiol-disulfide isomerase